MIDPMTFNFVLLGICLVFSAFFSGTEAAFLASQHHRLRHLAASGSASAQIVEKMVDRPERFLSTVLVGNNIVNTAAAAITTAIAVSVISNPEIAVLSATAVTTLALLIFGELTPKTVAARHAERSMLVLARPFRVVAFILTPLTIAFGAFAALIAHMVGGSRRSVVSVEELQTLVRTGVEEGSVEEQEAELVRKVFRFGDRMVREVMTPRTEIAWVKAGTTFQEFLGHYGGAAHSRFPVFADEQDQVVGILSIKDILRGQASGVLSPNSSVTTTLRPAYFVPETKRIADLLEELREQRTQVALVVDEFGSIAGLVTLRRLVEELVGRVEEPGEETTFQELDERTVIVDGSLRIEELREQLDILLPSGEGRYETVAGFILEQLGHVPQAGEEVQHGTYRLTVEKMQGPRIDRVVIRTEQP